jgi:hypothetical protein
MRHSILSLEPANEIAALGRFCRIASAIAIAGYACPPVPPPVMRILGSRRFDMTAALFNVTRNIEQNADHNSICQHGGTAIRHEGERQTGDRQ